MGQASDLLPPPGTATVAQNLAQFVERGISVLVRVIPAFAGLLSQPGALRRFHDLVGGDAAFEGAAAAGAGPEPGAAGPARRTRPRRPGRLARPARQAARACRTSSSATCWPSSGSAASTPRPTSPRPAPCSSARSMARCCRGCCSPRRAPPSARHRASARGWPRWSWTASRRRPGEPGRHAVRRPVRWPPGRAGKPAGRDPSRPRGNGRTGGPAVSRPGPWPPGPEVPARGAGITGRRLRRPRWPRPRGWPPQGCQAARSRSCRCRRPGPRWWLRSGPG